MCMLPGESWSWFASYYATPIYCHQDQALPSKPFVYWVWCYYGWLLRNARFRTRGSILQMPLSILYKLNQLNISLSQIMSNDSVVGHPTRDTELPSMERVRTGGPRPLTWRAHLNPLKKSVVHAYQTSVPINCPDEAVLKSRKGPSRIYTHKVPTAFLYWEWASLHVSNNTEKFSRALRWLSH